MARMILGVVAGYLIMVVVAIGGIGVAWILIGAEGAFQEGSVVASTTWSLVNLVFGFVAALIGGVAAVAIGKHANTARALAGLVLVLGLILAIAALGEQPEPLPEGKTVAELTFTEAGDVAMSPNWYNFVIPLVGVIGVTIGGGLRAK